MPPLPARPFAFALALLAALPPALHAQPDAARWKAEAARVSIVRDTWGIAHVHGKSDADAVFGMIYAQCEDDFPRVESNYLAALGRTAEAEGEAALWADLRQRLFIDPAELQQEYAASPANLRALMDAWADGLNFFLARHPDVHPRVLSRFEPWMALSFTEGSIGGDIERVDLTRLRAFYDRTVVPAKPVQPNPATPPETALLHPDDTPGSEPGGSNGFAIAPANTRDHHALLLINPHTSFFFRSELQMTSDAGLNAYGAVTWGQFFIYQGFNERAGWMHTSSNVDAIDEYLETQAGADTFTYRHGDAVEPYRKHAITLAYRTPDGSMRQRLFTTFSSVHGPVVREQDGRWVTIQLMQRHVAALEQSYGRTRAHSYAEFAHTMELMGNSSNNTIYADADGTIAYWHGDFIPRRDPRFNFTRPVEGADPATDWHGLHPLAEVPQLRNPASGYLFNVNDSPWNGAGASSLRKADFPAYVEQGIETARGVHAMRVLAGHADFTLESLRAAAYDSALPWFDRTLPTLLAAYDALPADAPQRVRLRGEIALLRGWDRRWSASSTATSLAVFWGDEVLRPVAAEARARALPSEDYVATEVAAPALLNALEAASDKLNQTFGTWQVAWGEINRFERVTGDLVQPFTDAAASLPVPFTSSQWGSLASFGARPYPGTRRWYGTSGNSFVAVVEFGPRVRALAVTAGGESGHPGTPHFNDQAVRYAAGDLREVWFYPDQLKRHTERTYRPGEERTGKR